VEVWKDKTLTLDTERAFYQFFKKEHAEEMWEVKFASDEDWKRFVNDYQSNLGSVLSEAMYEFRPDYRELFDYLETRECSYPTSASESGSDQDDADRCYDACFKTPPATPKVAKQIEAELENLPQYEVCCGECEKKLTINTPIMCYTSPHSEDCDETLCNDCYWECEYWKDDANEANKEEVEEKIESLMKKLKKVMTKADKEELRAIITKRT
jgi:hypothetical protein